MPEGKPLARILVVDDEEDIARIIKQGLEQNGFQAEAYTDPSVAMEHFRHYSKEYCVVLTDYRMPGMTGFQVAREAKLTNPDIKVILTTAFEIKQEEFSKVLPSTRIDDFIEKPANIKTIIDVLLKHIGETKTLSDIGFARR